MNHYYNLDFLVEVQSYLYEAKIIFQIKTNLLQEA